MATDLYRVIGVRAAGRALLLLLCLLLAACSGTSQVYLTPSPTAPAVATTTPVPPVIPEIHRLTLPNFMASFAFPNAHGLVLYGTPGTVGRGIGPAGGYALYYYDNATQAVETLATPTPAADGAERGIYGTFTAGDWIAYVIADSVQSQWELWVVNVVTGARHLVDSYSIEHSAGRWGGDAATDGTDLVWSATIVTSSGAPEHVLRQYHLATGQTHTLLSGSTVPGVGNLAMSNGTIYYTEDRVNPSSNFTGWLWTLSQPTPTQIAVVPGGAVSMNDRYLVWNLSRPMDLFLYDRQTRRQVDSWVRSCVAPAIADDRPYVACYDWDAHTYRLVQVPSGANTTFGDGQAGSPGITIGNDRVYWVAAPTGSPYGNQIAYFDLPAS